MSDIPSRRLMWKELGVSKADIEEMDYRDYSDTLNALQLIIHRESSVKG